MCSSLNPMSIADNAGFWKARIHPNAGFGRDGMRTTEIQLNVLTGFSIWSQETSTRPDGFSDPFFLRLKCFFCFCVLTRILHFVWPHSWLFQNVCITFHFTQKSEAMFSSTPTTSS